MSKLISELLGANEPMFSLSIRQLEKVSGRPGIDIRLATEIIKKVERKSKELGFDPKDTMGRELYHGLINRIKNDDQHLASKIGVNSTSESKLEVIKNVALKAKIPKKAWVIKKSVAKEFLKKSPPLAIMRQLHYKSVDSMLKTESVAEIYGALRFAETADWLKKFNAGYKTLTPSDFEQRDIEIIEMPKDRWGDVAKSFVKKKRHSLTHSKELGVVYLLPVAEERLVTIAVLALILHYINEIRLYSTFFKLKQVNRGFGKIVAETLNADPKNTAKLAGQDIHWRAIQRYYGKKDATDHPEIFEPHVQPEDLIWRQAERQLSRIDPQLSWWNGLDYAAVMDKGKPVSLNLMDIVICYSNNLAFEERVHYHFRESLWNELFSRYMGENVLEQQILKSLDSQMATKETIYHNLHGRSL